MKNISQMQLLSAAGQFALTGTVLSITPYGNGHINGTYLLVTTQKRYILQALNTQVFPHPDYVMENIEKVTNHLSTKCCDPRRVLTLVRTHTGAPYYIDALGNFFRVYIFVEDSVCIETPQSAGEFYQCALAFGEFQRQLTDFAADTLRETIPNFHNTPKRYSDFLNAVQQDTCGRAKEVQKEIDFICARADFYSTLLDAYNQGILPLRVTHNDTKCNNVLLDAKTREGLCVIDLDTVMPGFSVTDFGDSIRFGANTAAEDEKDLSKVALNMELYTAYVQGFLKGCGGLLTKAEVELLPEGAKMMTMECGMRFLADYLQGDVYFRTAYPEHNLVRCRTQLALTAAMEQNWDAMKKVALQNI